METSLLKQFKKLKKDSMDPLTAGLTLATQLLKNHEMLFEALSPEARATEASNYFNGLQKIREFGDQVISLFHKKD